MLILLRFREDLRQGSENRFIAESVFVKLLGMGWISVLKSEEKCVQIVGKATSLKAATSNVGVIVNNKLAVMWIQAGVFHFNVLFHHFPKVTVGKT